MRNIIKALNYQTKSDIVTYCTLLPVAFLLATAFIDLDMEKTTGSYFVSYAGENFALVPIFCILMLGVRILGWDYGDKTMNYEILSGHHRREVYFARVIVAHIWCILFCLVFMTMPVIFFTALNGWGVTMDLKGAAIRFVLAIFPMIRLVCQYVLFVFIVKNSYIAWVLGYLLSMFSMMIPMLLEELTKKFRLTYHLAETNLMELFTFNQKIGYVNGEDVTVCQTELEPSFAAGTIIVSLAVSAVCIISGYIIFKKSDVN